MVSFSKAAISTLAVSALSTSVQFVYSKESSGRRLQRHELIAGYEPFTQVTDQNAIDLDQALMEEQLAIGTNDAFDTARDVYTDGAHSGSVAKVKLMSGLPEAIERGIHVEGVNEGGLEVLGKVYEDYDEGETEIYIQYSTSDDQERYVGCQVGASPAPNLDFCFVSGGTLDIGGLPMKYSYTPLDDNSNKRTMQGFSTNAQKTMGECDNCPYYMYKKFYDYYGHYDYADQIVMDALKGRKTRLKNFNNDYGEYGFEAKEAVVKKATAYMVVWMYVIRQMEDALDDCRDGCELEDCNIESIHAWDEAVAFYTGSLEGPEGNGRGLLAYDLADKMCQEFNTCGEFGGYAEGRSQVNIEMFKQFSIGLQKLLDGQCVSAREQKENIETLMLIPLIQGTLLYAFKRATEPFAEITEADGVIFTASVIPVVHSCNEDAAKKIAENMIAGDKKTTDWPAIESAFDGTYRCMDVDPLWVGRLYDRARGEYIDTDATYYINSGAATDSSVASFWMTTAVAGLAYLFA